MTTSKLPKVYYDLEANGFLGEANKVWCIVLLLEDDTELKLFDGGLHSKLDHSYELSDLAGIIKSLGSREFICHNQFGYDLEIMRTLLDIPYGYNWWGSEDNKVRFTDSLDLSQSLWPDRPLPKGCPSSIKKDGVTKRITPHGLEAWGYRCGIKKPEVEDWENVSLDVALDRCIEDVKITKATHQMLIDEMNRG